MCVCVCVCAHVDCHKPNLSMSEVSSRTIHDSITVVKDNKWEWQVCIRVVSRAQRDEWTVGINEWRRSLSYERPVT